MFKKKRELPEKYKELRRTYSYAKDDKTRLFLLGEMLKVIPPRRSEFNKVRSYTTHLMREIRERMRQKARREEAEERSRAFFKNDFFSIALLGDANTGKTYLLNSLCSTTHASTLKPYETKEPVIGVFKHKEAIIRIVEVPSAFRPEYARILRECDLIIIMPQSRRYVRYIKDYDIETPVRVLRAFPKQLWSFLGLIVAKLDGRPLVLFKGTTVSDLDMKEALVNGQKKGRNYVLKDGDVIAPTGKQKSDAPAGI